jgi:phosphomevalonate kinase
MTVPPGSPRTTVVSSPGKVLVAGGYLVLEPQYRGLVIATSSRFYCVVRDYHDAPGTGNNGDAEDVEDGVEGRDSVANDTRDTDSALIVVRAGQFPAESSTWRYRFSLEQPSSSATQEKEEGNEEMSRSATQGEEEKEEPPHPSIILAPLDASKRNKFVEITLSRTLALAWEMIAAGPAQAAGVGKGTTDTGVAGSIDADADVAAGRELLRRLRGEGRACHLVMLADNDFYSQREQVSATRRFIFRLAFDEVLSERLGGDAPENPLPVSIPTDASSEFHLS